MKNEIVVHANWDITHGDYFREEDEYDKRHQKIQKREKAGYMRFLISLSLLVLPVMFLVLKLASRIKI